MPVFARSAPWSTSFPKSTGSESANRDPGSRSRVDPNPKQPDGDPVDGRKGSSIVGGRELQVIVRFSRLRTQFPVTRWSGCPNTTPPVRHRRIGVSFTYPEKSPTRGLAGSDHRLPGIAPALAPRHIKGLSPGSGIKAGSLCACAYQRRQPYPSDVPRSQQRRPSPPPATKPNKKI